MIKKIILVFKTHFDIGFTDLAENVIRGYGSDMLRQVIETCNATEHLKKLRYVWTMPAWPLWYICNHCDPALKPELDRLIENGQIVWHALPFTSHTDFSAPDEYAQTFRYSRELANRYGKPMPVAAKMTDVPGHGLMLPDILDQAGVKFLHLGCNEFATPPDVPNLFFWNGPGGGKVLTMYSKGGYGTGLLPPEDWPYPVWMAMMHTHDNCGPQSADLIQKMAAKAQAAYPEAEIVCGTMDDFYREIAKCDLSAIPEVDKDLADTWIHGIGSYPAEVSLMRACRERARKLHVRYLEKMLSDHFCAGEVEKLWEQYYDAAALFSEHTWGADVKTWLGPDRVYEKEDFIEARTTERYRFMERSWDEQRQRAAQAKQCLDKLEILLGSVEPACVENTSQCLDVRQQNEKVFVSNHRYRLEFDGVSGQIDTVYDRNLETVLLKAGEEGVFSYRYDRYGLPDITEFLRSYGYHFTTWGIQDYGRENYPDCSRLVFYPQFDGWEVTGRELRLNYHTRRSSEDYGDGKRMTLSIWFPEKADELNVTFHLENKQASPYVESGSIVIPLAGDVSYRIGKPGGVIAPNQIQDCANHALFHLEREVTVIGKNAALLICSKDAPLFGIGSTGVYEYYKQFDDKRKPVIYFNLFNNMWGTNFPQWTEGSFTYRFVLRGVPLRQAEDAPVWAAEICRGKTDLSHYGIHLPQGMELVLCRSCNDRVYITLRDLTGRKKINKLSAKGMSLLRTNLAGEPVGAEFEDEISFCVRPYGLHVFALSRRKP